MKKRSAVISLLVLAAAAATGAAADGADGKALYGSKCAVCHGADGVAKPMAKGSANFNEPEYQKANDADAIVTVTLEGKGKMPKFQGKLSPDQAKAVADYVKTLGTGLEK